MSKDYCRKPGCKGCRYQGKGGGCNFSHIAGVSRLKLGSLMYPDGGCAQYAKRPRARESRKT